MLMEAFIGALCYTISLSSKIWEHIDISLPKRLISRRKDKHNK